MHFNELTPAEAERLALVAEECNEIGQAICKILRHGYESTHPNGGPTNRQSLQKELGQLQLAVSLMCRCNDVDVHAIGDAYDAKSLEINQWLHHNSLGHMDLEPAEEY